MHGIHNGTVSINGDVSPANEYHNHKLEIKISRNINRDSDCNFHSIYSYLHYYSLLWNKDALILYRGSSRKCLIVTMLCAQAYLNSK